MIATLPPRFAAKLDTTGECWIWTGAVNSRGYGQFGHEGRSRSTHRLAYTWLVGPIPAGLVIDHLCRVKACCNPAHLEAVTSRENTGRSRADRGHPRQPIPETTEVGAVVNLGGRTRGPVVHGTVGAYTNGDRCRCDLCREAKAADRRRAKARKLGLAS